MITRRPSQEWVQQMTGLSCFDFLAYSVHITQRLTSNQKLVHNSYHEQVLHDIIEHGSHVVKVINYLI